MFCAGKIVSCAPYPCEHSYSRHKQTVNEGKLFTSQNQSVCSYNLP